MLAVADFNDDGNLDITTLWATALGNGDGTFQAPIHDRAGVAGNISCISVGDFNQDGNADLVISGPYFPPGGKLWVLLGQGDGRVALSGSIDLTYTPASIVSGDVNGDGKLDVILTGTSSTQVDAISVLLGRGDGTFQDPKDFDYSSPGHPTFVAAADFNKDGNLDLAITDSGPATEGYSGASVSLLLGNGDGTFQPAVGYDVGRNPGRVTVSDFNGDGNSDLAVVNFASQDISVLLGNGNGTFRSAVNYSTPITPQSLVVGDFNGDGKPDLAVGGRIVSLLLGSGDGTFQRFSDYEISGAEFMVGGDFNGDGKLDLATVGRLLLGRGDGTFFNVARTYAVGSKPQSIAVADFDADGKPDFAVANWQGGSISVLPGNGDGSFRSAVNYEAGVDNPLSIVTGDFNGDGISDLAVVSYEGVSVLMGSGDGTFLPPITSSAPDGATFLAAGDFNGDNKLDLAVGGYGKLENFRYVGGGVTVLLGNGDGTFQTAGFIEARFLNSIALGDFDSDGKTDLAAVIVTGSDPSEPAIRTTGVLVVHGNGDGTFGGSVIYAVSIAAAVATADLNGDHKLDLAVYNGDNPTGRFDFFHGLSVLLGNGDGTFQLAIDSGGYRSRASGGNLTLADLNGDGRLDALVCDSSSLMVALGNGDGTFQIRLPLPMAGNTQNAVTGDLNGDSKPDVIVAQADYDLVSVLLNTCDGNSQGAVHTHVTAVSPAGRNGGYLNNGFDAVVLTFNKPIDTNSFNSASFSITGPKGPIAFSGPLEMSNLSYRVSFPLQIENGAYRFVLLTRLRDIEGFHLDQNTNGIPGEPSDAYSFTLTLDTVAPRVLQHAPTGDLPGPLSHVDLWVNGAFDERTLTTGPVIFDPLGQTIAVTNIQVVGLNRFRVSFAPQTTPGQYRIRLGPEIQDLAGNSLDQNQNGIFGETEDDVYEGAFNLVAVDLGLSNLAISTNQLWAGDTLSVTWQGLNRTGAPLLGDWIDAIYISADDKWDINDLLLDVLPHSGGLAANEVYSASVNVHVPALLPGNYHILVRPDILNGENSGAPTNLLSTGPVPLNVRAFSSAGGSFSGLLTPDRRSSCYAINVPAGQSLLLRLAYPSTNAAASLYIRAGAIPTILQYDQRASGSGPNLQTALSNSSANEQTYHVLVYGELIDDALAFELSAQIGPLFLTGVTPSRHGNAAPATLTVSGAGFDNTTTVDLVSTNGAVFPSDGIELVSPTVLRLNVNLANRPAGLYTVRAVKGAATSELADAFEIVRGGTAHLATRLMVPPIQDINIPIRQTIWIEYRNEGEIPMPAPLLLLRSDQNPRLTADAARAIPRGGSGEIPGTSDTVQVVGAGSSSTPGILQPGESGRLPVYYLGPSQPTSAPQMTFTLSTVTATAPVVRSLRPNEKFGPVGFDAPAFVSGHDALPYQIRFENKSGATGPVRRVAVTDTLDANLDLRTLELTEITFGPRILPVPSGLNHYESLVPMTVPNTTNTILVDVRVALEASSRMLTLTLTALDPNTGLFPEDPLVGLLYPNNDTGRGVGSLSYLVKPRTGVPTGTRIENRASIVFDYNDPTDTPAVVNTIDATPPVSSMTSLPGISARDFLVQWSATDDATGIASYDVYVSEDGGNYIAWRAGVTNTSGTFDGVPGHSYEFYAIARDNVGNARPSPSTPDAQTTVLPTNVPAVAFRTPTTINEDNTTYDGWDIIISGATVTIDGPHRFNSLLLTNNAVLTHSPCTTTNTHKLDLKVANDIVVSVDSRIDVIGKGYLPEHTTGNTTLGGARVHSGGSYGGRGGSSRYQNDGSQVGTVYGDYAYPNDWGGGGGGSPGAGQVSLVARTLHLDGEITAIGAVTGTCDAGAGGGVLVMVTNLTGTGSIRANGGNACPNFGTGGGGRVAVYASDFSGFNLTSITALGGVWTDILDPISGSSAGTVYLRDSDEPVGTLIIDARDGGINWTPLGLAETNRTTFSDLVVVRGENTHVQLVSASALLDFGALTVTEGGRMTATTVSASGPISISAGGTLVAERLLASDVLLSGNAVLTHPACTATETHRLEINVAGVVAVSADSRIDVSEKGYLPGYTTGNTTVGASEGGAGGSYGGLADFTPIQRFYVNATYGDYADPNDWGSGSGSVNGGSAGGGLVRLMAHTLQLDGEILANGGANGIGGRGSGGGVLVVVTNLTGTGSIKAAGLDGNNCCGNGGGGRIAVYASDYSSFNLDNLSARGGKGKVIDPRGASDGGPGTVYIRDRDEARGTLRIDARQGGRGVTPLPQVVPDLLVVSSATQVAEHLSVPELWLTNGAVLTHLPCTATETHRLEVNVAGLLTVSADSRIDVSGKGYMAGQTRGNTTVGAATGSSGGSYGGLGGNSFGVANAVYGDSATPEEWGSGSSRDTGSSAAGGGRLKLVAQSLQLHGQILANGAVDCSGGAGGSVLVVVTNLTGGGSIAASGGNIGCAGWGGGGGGRIAVYATDLAGFNLNAITAPGGVGDPANSDQPVGTAGTVWIVNRSLLPIISPSLASSGDFVLTFASQIGRSYIIEASTDLVVWHTVTNFISTAATIEFVDRETVGVTERFYRVTTP